VHETRKADNDYLMEELEIVPGKVAIEDKYVVNYPINESKTDTDKHIEDQYVKENNVTS
jgi:hypothetical protein